MKAVFQIIFASLASVSIIQSLYYSFKDRQLDYIEAVSETTQLIAMIILLEVSQ